MTYNGQTGTYTIDYLKSITDRNVKQFGLEDVGAAIAAEMQAHDQRLREMMAAYATPTTEREMADATGNMLTGELVLADEFGRAPTQVTGKPGRVGLPMQRFKYAIGYTADFLENATPAQVAVRAMEAQAADRRKVIQVLRDSVFRPVNYTFIDELVDDLELGVKALFNADGTLPVNGPNGEVFAGTHNHYHTASALNEAALDSLIEEVAEHSDNANVEIHVNVAETAVIRALTGFIPVVDSRVVTGANETVGRANLDTGNIKKRLIGYYNGAEIHTKPWIYPGYLLALNTAAPIKALGFREPAEAGRRGFRLVAQNVMYPLQTENMERRFGFGVRNRGAAAVLQITAGAYTDPTA